MRPGILPFCFLLALALASPFTTGQAQTAATVQTQNQPPQAETIPFTVWLDFQRLQTPGVSPTAMPIWLAGVTTQHQGALDGNAWTIIRIQFRPLSGFDQKRLLRVFFDDVSGESPKIVGLTSDGTQKFARGPLGEGLDLPTSESIIFPTDGVDSVEIQVPGDGANIRGAFLATLSTQTMLRAFDFKPPAELLDAFGRPDPAQPSTQDWSLFGRVKATLDTGTVKLTAPDQTSVTWEFDLQTPPLMALVDFETLNADGEAPLQITVNDQPLGAVEVRWPDLADPGYIGLVRPLVEGMHFHYAGWLRAQKVVPGTLLKAGVNRLVLQLHPEAGPAAVRALELQLKHNWTHLDYAIKSNAP
jgi:hypothetical protein